MSAGGAPAVPGSPRPRGERLATLALWVLALTLPVGAIAQPWLFPSRSALPAVPLLLDAPVILVTVAGLRADRVHHLGCERAVTPALDDFRRAGASFESAWSSSNDERATVAAILTGLCPAESGVRGPRDSLPNPVQTLGERARDYGYATGAVLANPALIGANLEQGFRHVQPLPGASADAAFSAALALLDGPLGSRYVLWIDLGDLLPPYGGAALDLSAVAPDAPTGFGASPADYGLDEAQRVARGWGDREARWLSLRYDAALTALDAALGRFLAALDERRQLDAAMVIVAGTRGERLDERPGPVGAHGIDLFDPSLHVPLLVRMPARFFAGQLNDRLALSVDIGPTIAELGLHQAWTGVRGESLAPALRNHKPVRAALFSEGQVVADDGDRYYGYAMLAASDKPSQAYKLITDLGGARATVTMRLKDPDERRLISVAPGDFKSLWKAGDAWWQGCTEP
jgi:arylsulfatase A-like enzyme